MPTEEQLRRRVQELQRHAFVAAEEHLRVGVLIADGDRFANFRDVHKVLSGIGEQLMMEWEGMLTDAERLCVETYLFELEEY